MSLVASALGLHPYACLFIDATWKDMMRAYVDVVLARDTDQAHKRIQALFHPDSLVGISARTVFDCWLKVQNFPPGSEIILTAINIPDMSKVLREHKIVPVPVDVCAHSLSPAVADLERLITPKTVGILVAQIYGRQFPLDAFVAVAKKHNLPLIEDLAEGYAGPKFTGSPDAQLSLFSFGPIKYNTAFGGGIGVIRDAVVLAKMRKLHASYNTRSRYEMLQKLLKYSVVMSFLNVPLLSGLTMRLTKMMGIDHKDYVVALLRGFPDRFFERLRHQPDPVMLSLLERRLREFSASDYALSAQRGELLSKLLKENETKAIIKLGNKHAQPVITIPGQACPVRNYWLFPISVEKPQETIKALNAAGVDAYRGATQLALVDTPPEWKDKLATPPSAKRLMDTTVYLPIHKRTPVALVHTLAATVAQVARQVNQQPVFSSECTLNSTQGSSQLKATPVAAQIDQSNATSSTTPAPRETLPRRLLNKVNALRVRISSSL